jgi:hypothetical protein
MDKKAGGGLTRTDQGGNLANPQARSIYKQEIEYISHNCGGRCSICKLPDPEQVTLMRRAGASLQDVQDYVWQEWGIEVSFSAISRHMKKTTVKYKNGQLGFLVGDTTCVIDTTGKEGLEAMLEDAMTIFHHMLRDRPEQVMTQPMALGLTKIYSDMLENKTNKDEAMEAVRGLALPKLGAAVAARGFEFGKVDGGDMNTGQPTMPNNNAGPANPPIPPD